MCAQRHGGIGLHTESTDPYSRYVLTVCEQKGSDPMTWSTFHSRGAILHDIVETADARRDGVLPWDLPGVSETFRDELDLIAALQLKWHARLSGNIERALMSQPLDLEDAVASAWNLTSEQLPGVRMILDRYAESPSGPEM